jgi:hypothetical protein
MISDLNNFNLIATPHDAAPSYRLPSPRGLKVPKTSEFNSLSSYLSRSRKILKW